jgi:hypothetical protein
MTGELRYLKQHAVDRARWDHCVQAAPNGLIYAHSFYLDALCDHWGALVLNDYEAVMPLPWRRKWGVYYLYQPFLAPVLGVFGRHLDPQTVSLFLEGIPAQFRLRDFSLNAQNPLDEPAAIPRSNYLLPLDRPYNEMAAGYHDNIRRAIRKAGQHGCTIRTGIPLEEIIRICRATYPRFMDTRNTPFPALPSVFGQAPAAVTYGVYTREAELVASCAFIGDGRRWYYWLVGNETAARNYGASALLVDAFLRDHSEEKSLLDFEGSDVASVAAFYKKFGAREERYWTLFENRLPFPLRLLKPLPRSYRELRSRHT